jgi:hypothetical protein
LRPVYAANRTLLAAQNRLSRQIAIADGSWNFPCAIITATALVRKMANPSNQPPAVLALMRA